MNDEEWSQLKPNEIITSLAGRNQILPVRLILKDHNKRWIVYQLNISYQPVSTLVLAEKPAIWQRLAK